MPDQKPTLEYGRPRQNRYRERLARQAMLTLAGIVWMAFLWVLMRLVIWIVFRLT
jgi:hypothetical protein